MKYLINYQDLNEFDLQIKRFFEENKEDKFIDKIMFYYRKFRSFCFKFVESQSITLLIKQIYLPKQTFYYWAKKFYQCFYEQKPLTALLFKSTKPKNIKYFYDYHLSYKFIDYFVQYRDEYGIGAFQFCYLVKNIDDVRFNVLPKPGLKTIYRWLKRFNLNTKIKKKKNHPQYEVKEIGLLQTDIKVISENITGANKRWYILDYIDEKTRIVYSYSSQECQTIDVKIATEKALAFYQKIGIKVTRIRTDNGVQYTTNTHGKYRANKWFTNFCKENGIVHETTPFRSPQSNGKIERFHRNWSNLFEIKPYLNNDFTLFQKLVNSFQEYYNNYKPHKSLKLMTPMDYFAKILLNK